VVAQDGSNRSFDAVQAAQVAARSYASVMTSDSVLNRLGDELGGGRTSSDLAGVVGAAAVAETQLIRITAEDPSPREARTIAVTHARVFIDYASEELAPTTGVAVRLVAPPSVPATPFKPQPRVYVLLAALLGLGAGVALALVRERTDPRIRSAAGLEAFGFPVLAELPAQRHGARDATLTEDTFRLLYIKLQHGPAPPSTPSSDSSGAGAMRPIVASYTNTLAITALPDAASTHVVVGLARAAAGAGSAVIVVDAGDAPERRASAALGVPGEASPGLGAWLEGAAPVSAVLRPSAIPAVLVLDATDAGGALSTKLESPAAAAALSDLTAAGDVVVWDCPRADAGADIAAIAAHVHAVLVVVDLQTARRDALRTVLDRVASVGGQPLGFVIDRGRAGARDAAVPESPEPDGVVGRHRDGESRAPRPPQWTRLRARREAGRRSGDGGSATGHSAQRLGAEEQPGRGGRSG
jgi:capsular polysaccharide biosynthesis protein/Mrp family chromosome partitioning ATPase